MVIKEYWKNAQEEIDGFLDKKLPKVAEKPGIIFEAMRYSVFAGGKRVRPVIALMINDMLGGKKESVLYPASSLELIHTYSLIHDDLPSLDNDDFRRGKPSNHKQFGEAIAILAGDSLLTLAFQWIAKTPVEAEKIVKISEIVSDCAGVYGMIGGQVADLQAEGRIEKNEETDNEKELEYIHLHKTAALIKASVIVGALVGGANEKELELCSRFGTLIGLAFQVVDDILDIEGDEKLLGKSVGKDVEAGKLTYPALYGLEESKIKAKDLIQESKDIIDNFKDSDLLKQLADMIINRKN